MCGGKGRKGKSRQICPLEPHGGAGIAGWYTILCANKRETARLWQVRSRRGHGCKRHMPLCCYKAYTRIVLDNYLDKQAFVFRIHKAIESISFIDNADVTTRS